MNAETPCNLTVGPYHHVGGLEACPWLKDYGDSPGIPHDFLAVKVLELARMIQILGWEAVLGLGPHLECSAYEADLVRQGILWVLGRDGEKRTVRRRK